MANILPAPPLIDAPASTASLRTLGTGAQQAAAGNDSRFLSGGASLISGRIVVGGGANTIINSNFTASGNTLDLAAAGNITVGGTATGIVYNASLAGIQYAGNPTIYPGTTGQGQFGNSSNIWNQAWVNGVYTQSVNRVSSGTLYLGNDANTTAIILGNGGGTSGMNVNFAGQYISLGNSTGDFHPYIYNYGSIYLASQPATNVATLQSTQPFYFRGTYWNGTASTDFFSHLQLVVDGTTPTGHLELVVGGNTFAFYDYGSATATNYVASGLIYAPLFDRSSAGNLLVGTSNATNIIVGGPNATVTLGNGAGSGQVTTSNPIFQRSAAATAGSPLQNAPAIFTNPNYWNGSASTGVNISLQGVVDSTTPTSHLQFNVNGLAWLMMDSGTFGMPTTAAAGVNGTKLTIQAMAGGTGTTTGGNIVLQPGAKGSTGTTDGKIQFNNASGSVLGYTTTDPTYGGIGLTSPDGFTAITLSNGGVSKWRATTTPGYGPEIDMVSGYISITTSVTGNAGTGVGGYVASVANGNNWQSNQGYSLLKMWEYSNAGDINNYGILTLSNHTDGLAEGMELKADATGITTGLNTVVKWGGSKLISNATTGDTTNIAGVLITGGGANSRAVVAKRGRCYVKYTGTVAAGDIVVYSTTTAGYVMTNNAASAGAMIGRATEAGGGTATGYVQVDLLL